MLHKNRVKNRTHMTSFRVIIISFFCLILVGSLLLMLPISSRQRCVTSFPDAMFTAVSATCVTGLVVKDTATYWSLFGQAVILMLIQIGGMGVITVGLAIIRASGRFSAMILVSLRDCGIPCFTAYRLFAMQALICSA